MVPQKEASPFLDKKIEELEVKLADLEDGDDDMEDMDEEDEAPETPSMPQMQTPLSSDMEMMPYMPSQVTIHFLRSLANTFNFHIQVFKYLLLILLVRFSFFLVLKLCFFIKSTPKVKGLSKKEGAKRKMNMSGYILFSSEMRAVIKARHPDYSFGELSRLVGTEWRNLEGPKKTEYEGENKQFMGKESCPT